MKYQFNDFIGEFQNVIGPVECERIINYFENTAQLGMSQTRQECERGECPKTRKDDSTVFHDFTLPKEMVFTYYPHLDPVIEAVKHCYDLYVQEYDMLKMLASHANSPAFRIQKTKPGQGYHVWHSEHTHAQAGSRILAWTLYLNDVAEGGETEFLYQKRRVYPKRGTVVIWPAGFTHTHRGNPPLSNDKYIVTSWIQFTS